MNPDRVPDRSPRWPAAVGLVLCLAGLAVSAYLAIEHADRARALACPESATINCLKVTTSRYSEIAGVPVAYLGVGYFVLVSALASLALWRPARGWSLALSVAATAGVVFVLYLVWAEAFGLHAICLWCTAVHVITFVLFAVTLLGEALQGAGMTDPDPMGGRS